MLLCILRFLRHNDDWRTNGLVASACFGYRSHSLPEIGCVFVIRRKCGPNKVGFVGKSCKDLQTTKTKEWSHQKKKWATQTILESQENNLLKWYGHVVRMDYKIWRKRIMTWSPEARRQRGRPDVKWEKEVESVMTQRNLTSDDAVNRQQWRMKTVNRRTLENIDR